MVSARVSRRFADVQDVFRTIDRNVRDPRLRDDYKTRVEKYQKGCKACDLANPEVKTIYYPDRDAWETVLPLGKNPGSNKPLDFSYHAMYRSQLRDVDVGMVQTILSNFIKTRKDRSRPIRGKRLKAGPITIVFDYDGHAANVITVWRN